MKMSRFGLTSIHHIAHRPNNIQHVSSVFFWWRALTVKKKAGLALLAPRPSLRMHTVWYGTVHWFIICDLQYGTIHYIKSATLGVLGHSYVASILYFKTIEQKRVWQGFHRLISLD